MLYSQHWKVFLTFMEVIVNKSIPLPFGLQFAEQPVTNNIAVPISIYDEDEDISVVIDENGQRIPSVEYCGKVGTKTFTNVKAEETDEDQDSPGMVGTKTGTAVKEEEVDSDDDHFLFILGTKTETYVKSEQSDEDPGIDTGPKSPLSTGTATKVAEEITDKD